jgi:hypothetical protein
MGEHMAESVERQAMALARRYFERNGWEVVDVTRLSGEHAGYDLSVTKDSKRLKIEVKGSSKAYAGIPDLYGASVDQDRRLVADMLCVAYFPESGPVKMAIKLRDDFPPDAMVPKFSYCIKNEYKNAKSISGRLVDVDGPLPDYVVDSATS